MYTLTLNFETEKDKEILSELLKHKDEETFIKDMLHKVLIEEKSKTYEITEDALNQIDNLWNDKPNKATEMIEKYRNM